MVRDMVSASLSSAAVESPVLIESRMCVVSDGSMSSPVLTANVKSALLRGWRERWPDERWSVAVKRHFPQGASGDVCQLAGECCI